MKKALALLLFAMFAQVALAQQPFLSTQFTEFFNTPPPAILNTQTSSNPTGTGVQVSSTGGTIAAGTYRLCVTFFTLTNTETTCSPETAATSTVTTTGATSTIVVKAPVSAGVNGSNVVGYRVYGSGNGGTTGQESLLTPSAATCTLSASSTPSCALTSDFTLTSGSGLTNGSGGPATSTAMTPPLNNAAATALFENSGFTYRVIYWTVSGTAPGTCTIQFQTGAAPASLSNVGQSLTCTSSGSYALPNVTTAAYLAANLSAFTPGDTTTKVAFYITSQPYGPPLYFGNAVPSGTCLTGATFLNSAGAVSTTVYTCNAGTWTATTVP